MPVAALSDLLDPRQCRRLVLKIGSSLLIDAQGDPRREWLTGLCGEIAEGIAAGQSITVVSSGAVALGGARLGLDRGAPRTLTQAQAAASIGQIALANLWSDKLTAHGITAAQMLLTLDDLEDRRRYLNATATLAQLMDAGVVAVINENDSVATEEIRFGDNDRLAARVAQASGADAVVLLSDVDGLFDRHPEEKGARLVRDVARLDERLRAAAADSSSSGLGRGGMASKLLAADIAMRSGVALAIVNGTHERPLRHAVATDTGTLFRAQESAGARKAWLGGRIAPAGELRVDSGCETALAGGASLLAAGITEVVGEFGRGALLRVVGTSGAAIAQGLSEYDSAQIAAIKGLSLAEHGAALGHAPRPAVIHRDHLVLL